MADVELVDAFRRGDERAFRSIYGEYGRMVFAVAYGVLGEKSNAEEAVQQTFVRAWEHASSFDVDRSLGAWLAVIAKRVAIDIWRRERRRTHDQLDEVASLAPAHADLVDDVWPIRNALATLDDDAQSLLKMLYHEGYTQQDVADRLGIPVGTVKSRTHTAQRRLAAALRRERLVPDEPQHERGPR